MKEPLIAPLAANKPVGELTITTPLGEVVAKVPLYPLKAVPEGGLVDPHGRQRRALVQMTAMAEPYPTLLSQRRVPADRRSAHLAVRSRLPVRRRRL